jgi:hypothetical protein
VAEAAVSFHTVRLAVIGHSFTGNYKKTVLQDCTREEE